MSSNNDTTMEEEYEDSFLSSRDGFIYRASDRSSRGESMISGPNIVLSSTSTDNRLQQEISAAGGRTDDLMAVSSSSSSSSRWFKNNNNQKQSEVKIFNVDFRALSQVALASSNNKEAEAEAEGNTLTRPRVVWSIELHQRFVNVVNHLGVENAVPKTIMKLMSVDGLTLANVASHLQKYRLNLKRLQWQVGQQVQRMGASVHNSSPYGEDLESATDANGRKVLTLFPSGDE